MLEFNHGNKHIPDIVHFSILISNLDAYESETVYVSPREPSDFSQSGIDGS